jgi:DHA1 family bicyclomycin/chloramphenicol resistance-like MFS transporter
MCSSLGFVLGSLLASKLFKWLGIDKTIKLGIQLALLSSLILLTGEWMNWNTYPLCTALNMGLFISSSALLWGGTTSRALQCFTEHLGAASAIRSLILLCFALFGTCFGKILPHDSLFAVGLFLLITSLTAFLVFHNKELKAERLTTDPLF